MKLFISVFSIFLSLIIFNCRDNPTGTDNNNTLVVEAFLYAGEPVTNIELTGTVSIGSSDTAAPPINDASVVLIKNNRTFELTRNPERNGYYIYQGSDLTVESGDSFFLEINYHNTQISSSTIVPPKPIDVSVSRTVLTLTTSGGFPGGFGEQDTNSIVLKWSNPDSSFYYVVIENLESNPVDISNGNFPGGPNIIRRTIFSPSPTSEFVISRRNLTYYGNHEAILYKVNQEYADLYESRNQDSRNLNEPLTNIKNGLGVFSAFASDTVFFDVKSE